MTQSPSINRPIYFTDSERKEFGLPNEEEITVLLDVCKQKDLAPFATATNSLSLDVTGQPYCYCGFCKTEMGMHGLCVGPSASLSDSTVAIPG